MNSSIKRNVFIYILATCLALILSYLLPDQVLGKEILQTQWQKSYSEPDRPNFVQQTKDGGFVIIGDDFSVQPFPTYVIKTNSLGKLEWKTKITALGETYIKKVIQTADAGYIAVGETYKIDTDVTRMYIVKLTAKGKIQWDFVFEPNSSGATVIQNSAGGYIVVGANHIKDWQDSKGCLVELTSEGELKSKRVFDSFFEITAVLQTSDEGYIVTGGSVQGINLMKINAAGELQWLKNYKGTSKANDYFDCGQVLIQTNDRGYLIGGYKYSGSSSNIALIKTDANGRKVWEKAVNGDQYDECTDIIQTPDGEYLINARWADEYSALSPFLVKIDGKGNILWKRFYDYGRFANIQLIKDNAYIVAETRYDKEFNPQGYLVKYKNVTVLPSTPKGLKAKASSYDQVNLTWNSVPEAKTYNVYRATSKNGKYIKLNKSAITKTAYSDKGLKPSKNYWYKITSVDPDGESKSTIAVSIKTKAK